ncbi:NifB/NifX family molybdenum-iron cluster-binding protein [Methanolobus psychrotolerans]|uniref:NifB/NifX family molybdenum-iron cluster-binding protein n=1 Tax=Methanolobus psychrotolerans TaxID=1874706 RepID=UPI000B91C97C|nr:NifB/NifX family molybdenum-iron cluster-binding protein [Methanolobus psychrotolerans]
MKICVTAMSARLDAPVDPHFGRCLYFVIVDVDSMGFEAIKNATASASSGAGVQAAQLILNRSVNTLITGTVGAKAFSMLKSKNVCVMSFKGGSVADAVQAYKSNILRKLEVSNSPGKHEYGGQNHIYKGTGWKKGVESKFM